MSQSLKILLVISIALFESFMVTAGTWIEHIDFVFVILLVFSIQTFGLIEIFSFLTAGFILESVSIVPFGMYAFAIGSAIVLGRTLFRTVFTQRSPYSLSLFCISLSSIFGVILFTVKSASSVFYNGNFSLSYQHLFLSILLDAIALFVLLTFQARKAGKKYFAIH